MRAISLLLCIAMLLSLTLLSCGTAAPTDNTAETPAGQTTDAATATTQPPTDPRLSVSDDLPTADYGGYNFRIFTHGEYVQDWVPSDQIGEVVNDAVYKRNKDVEERFNITISAVDSGFGKDDIAKHAQAIQRSVMAGEDAFDLALAHTIFGPNISLENVLYNLKAVKQFNFDKPWWPKQTVEELTLKDKMYLGSNTSSYTGLGWTKVVYVNKSKLKDYALDVPYNLVFEGKWTLDALAEMTRSVYEDLNGNGTRDNADFYGYVSHSIQNGFLVSADCPVLQKDNDSITIVANNDRVRSLVDKLYDWYTSPGCGILWQDNDKETGLNRNDWGAMMFAGGHSLFAFGFILDAAKSFRSSDVEYGILPQPKLDENQENYRAFTVDEFFCIPQTVTDIDRTGTIIEALSAEGYKQIIPAYYEIALKHKYLYDDESVRILDIITAARTVSFAYVYDNWEGFGHLFSQIFNGKPNRDYTSYYEKRVAKAQKRVDKIMAAFEANG